jgi:tetratricopeptide (TPR) repeat protein
MINNMKKSKISPKNRSGVWEIGIVPEPMFGTKKPNGKPFDMVIVVHRDSYFILNTNVIDFNENDEVGAVVKAFEDAITKGPLLPDTILVKDENMAEYLRESAAKHGAIVRVEKKLKAVQEVVRSMKRLGHDMPMELDQAKSVDDLYYDAMDALNDGNSDKAIRLLSRALEIDSHYVQTYVGLASACRREKVNIAKYREYTIKGYEETQKIFKKWPKELSWYDMDNRKYHRAIFFRAGLYIEDGEIEKGMELYRQLLKMWPSDNLGVRYYAAAAYAGKSIADVEEMWDFANENQKWDELEKMVIVQNRKHKFWKMPGIV